MVVQVTKVRNDAEPVVKRRRNRRFGVSGMNSTSEPNSFRILVLDDNYSMQRLVATALQKSGFQVSTASSAEEGLENIQRFGLPHLALVDIHMPYGMNGLDFCDLVLTLSLIHI